MARDAAGDAALGVGQHADRSRRSSTSAARAGGFRAAGRRARGRRAMILDAAGRVSRVGRVGLALVLAIPSPAAAYLKFGVTANGRQVTLKWAQTPRYFVSARSSVPAVT